MNLNHFGFSVASAKAVKMLIEFDDKKMTKECCRIYHDFYIDLKEIKKMDDESVFQVSLKA